MTEKSGLLTADRLKELFSYDAESGIFARRNYRGRPTKVGAVNANGYIRIFIDGKLYLAHRLAFLYMTGAWPEKVVDHLNGDPSDNRFCNLRSTDQKTNLQNKRRAQKTNKSSGLLGVTFNKPRGQFAASIGSNGKRIHLGYFSDPQEAHQAYLEKKRELHDGNTL